MLNELVGLQRSLLEFGIDAPPSHASIKEVRKAAFFRVLLGEAGVDAVEACGIDDLTAFASWTLRDGQQNSFPAISAKAGLIDSPDPALVASATGRDADGKKADISVDQRIAAIESLASGEIDPAVADGWPGYLPRIAERATHLAGLKGSDDEAVWLVFDRFARLVDDDGAGLLRSLAEAAARAAKSGETTTLALAADLLAGSGGQLYFDVVETRAARPVGHVDRRRAVARALADYEQSEETDEQREAGSGLCILTGQRQRLHNGNYPQPNLPYLGQTYLYSRNSDTPSAVRYGQTTQSVGRDLVSQLGGAIDWMCGEDGRGKRWARIAGERDGLNDLLLAYATTDPNIPLVQLFAEEAARQADDIAPGEDAVSDAEAAADLEEQGSRTVIEALQRQETGADRDPQVCVVILRQVDPANRKAVYTRTTTAAETIAAANRWNAIFAPGQTPPISVVVPPKQKGAAPIKTGLQKPSPLSLVELSRRTYVRGGEKTDRQEVIGLPASAAMDLFLLDDARPIAARFLGRLVRQLSSLVIGYAAAGRVGSDARRNFDAFAVRRTLSALHLLLARLGRPGTDVMTSPAYRLGQFLAACDTLHLGYCLDQRGGSIPPKLLGNAHMATAGRSPKQALDMLCRRFPIYIAWAEKARTEGREHPNDAKADKAKRDAYAVRRGFFAPFDIRRICPDLEGQLVGVAPDDAFRAELLLGYAAGPDRAEQSADETTDKPGDQAATQTATATTTA